MGLLISFEDFIGRAELTKNQFTESKINKYIEMYEEKYLIELLGVELFELFKADVDSGTKEPVTPIYIAIYEPIKSDEEKNNPLCSIGMKQMILQIIWCLYKRDEYQETIVGTQKGKAETSSQTIFDETGYYTRWNEATDAGVAIQKYINDNEDDYPTYNGNESDESFCGNQDQRNYMHWAL